MVDGFSFTIETKVRYSPWAIADIWAEGGELWDEFRPQLAALGWTGLNDDGPPRPPDSSCTPVQ